MGDFADVVTTILSFNIFYIFFYYSMDGLKAQMGGERIVQVSDSCLMAERKEIVG